MEKAGEDLKHLSRGCDIEGREKVERISLLKHRQIIDMCMHACA